MQIDTHDGFWQARRAAAARGDDCLADNGAADGTPQPTPVWFLWDGESVLIYSRPNQQKERNIGRNPKVSLNFDGDGHGGNIVVITGEAHVVADAPPATEIPEYVAKYAEPIKEIGMDDAAFARDVLRRHSHHPDGRARALIRPPLPRSGEGEGR